MCVSYLVTCEFQKNEMESGSATTKDMSSSSNILEVYDGVCSLENEEPVPLTGGLDQRIEQSHSSGIHRGKR